MDPNTLTLLAIGAVALLFLHRTGYLKPRPPTAAPAAPPTPQPLVQTLVLKHQIEAPRSAAPADNDTPVHETSILMPMTIRIIPQGPVAPPRE